MLMRASKTGIALPLHHIIIAATWLAMIVGAEPAMATFKDETRFTELSVLLGPATPTGSGIKVAHVEAHAGDPIDPQTGLPLDERFDFLPNPNSAQFQDPIRSFNVILPLGTSAADISAHATSTGKAIYGNTASVAPGITDIDVFLADNWLADGFLRHGTASLPRVAAEGHESLPTAQLGSHSWIGGSSSILDNLELLQRTDWLIHQDNFVQVVGVGNGRHSPVLPLLASAFNAIGIGRTEGDHTIGTVTTVGPLYQNARTRPDIVAPGTSSTSDATASFASAVTLLIETGQVGALTLSHGSVVARDANLGNTPNVRTIYHAETTEVIRAGLMAGANRQAITEHDNNGNFDTYVVNTSNGLNQRYGAGQLDILNTYQIITAGEHDSQEQGQASEIGPRGFDYAANFGDADEANYNFTTNTSALFTASLVWNVDIDISKVLWSNNAINSDLASAATLHDLDLMIYDRANSSLVAQASSTLENTEHLYLPNLAPGAYRLSVMSKFGQSFLWDYGLAWQVVQVPEPGGGTVLLTLIVVRTAIRARTRQSLS